MDDLKFIIYKGRNKHFYFELEVIKGITILVSDGYDANYYCRKGIAAVKENSHFDNRYDRRLAPSKQFYFILTDGNGLALGISEMYSSTQARENGIAAVKCYASRATIVDLSPEVN